MLPAHAFDLICSKHLHPKCIYLNANSMESSGTMFKAHVLWIAACHKPHFWLLVYYGSPFTLFCWFLHPQRYNFLFKVWFLKKWFKASPFQKVLVKTGVPGKEADPLLLEQASPFLLWASAWRRTDVGTCGDRPHMFHPIHRHSDVATMVSLCVCKVTKYINLCSPEHCSV